jgi:hypothetical protein
MPDELNPKPALLEAAETASIPAATEGHVIRDYFKKGAGVRIATVWDEFKTRFFDKNEGPLTATAYRKYRLLRISADGPIIAELGGEAKVEGPFGAAFALLQRQGSGEPGFLQTNGYANIFYSRDNQNILCAIRIGWADGGWVIDAISVQDPLAWNGKHEIFCPVPCSE